MNTAPVLLTLAYLNVVQTLLTLPVTHLFDKSKCPPEKGVFRGRADKAKCAIIPNKQKIKDITVLPTRFE